VTASARTDDIAFLKARVALLADFNDERLRELAAGSRIETYDAGDIIVYAGDELHFLAIILDGKIAASVPNADGTNQLLGELDPGETFGEMALMSGDPGVAVFAAADRSRVMLVPLTLF